MGWGRKKSSPSFHRNSIISRVFSVSWFSKLKQKGGDSQANSSKREKLDFSTPKGRFYTMDGEEAYWRLSFAEEAIKGRNSTGGINPLWHDSDDELDVPVSSFKSFDLRETEVSRKDEGRNFNFNDMVLDIKKMKEKRRVEKSMSRNGSFRSEIVDKEAEVFNRKTNATFDRKTRKKVAKGKEEELELDDDGSSGSKSSKPVEKVIFAIEPENCVSMKSEILNEKGTNVVPQWKNLEEIKVKNGPNPKSATMDRESHNSKLKNRNRVKAYSPRTECKIRALEEMRKTRNLKKKIAGEQVVGGRSVFDSFAVVKSSFDPYRDFRDSMIDMIIEKGIRSTEDLEELLACYLTLNRDEYHDLIIKVFRQVWFELNEDIC